MTELAALSEERLVADAVGASLGLTSDTDKGMTRRVTEYTCPSGWCSWFSTTASI